MRIADSVTYSRFFFGVAIVYFAYSGHLYLLCAAYLMNVFLDILDGHIARALGQSTEKGKRLDIIADNFIVLCLFIGLYHLRKELLIRYSWHMASIFGYFLLIQILNLMINKNLIFMRTASANLAAIIFPIAVISALFFESKVIILGYGLVMIYSLTEKAVISVSRKKAATIFSAGFWNIFVFLFLSLSLSYLFLGLPQEKATRVCFEDTYCIVAEIRDTDEGRAQGLMYRETLDEDEGMLFVFDAYAAFPFWMKNMLMPIDIIFLSPEKKIISVSEHAVPCTGPDNECELYYPSGEYLYVVEVKAGFSQRHGLAPGDSIDFEI